MKTGKWYFIKKPPMKTGWGNFQSRSCVMHITTQGKQFFNFLKENGYSDKFGSHECILSKIPNEYKGYWLRGLVDADGSYTRSKMNSTTFSISSGFNQNWEGLKQYFSSIDISDTFIYRIKKNYVYNNEIRTGGFSSFVFNKRRYFNIVNKLVYPTGWDNIGLMRKYNKLQYVLEICKKWLN